MDSAFTVDNKDKAIVVVVIVYGDVMRFLLCVNKFHFHEANRTVTSPNFSKTVQCSIRLIKAGRIQLSTQNKR